MMHKVTAERRVFFMKNGQISLLALTQTEHGQLIGSFDPRNLPTVTNCYAEYGSESARPFERLVRDSQDNGWKIVADVRPMYG